MDSNTTTVSEETKRANEEAQEFEDNAVEAAIRDGEIQQGKGGKRSKNNKKSKKGGKKNNKSKRGGKKNNKSRKSKKNQRGGK
jgi:hypothetical protein